MPISHRRKNSKKIFVAVLLLTSLTVIIGFYFKLHSRSVSSVDGNSSTTKTATSSQTNFTEVPPQSLIKSIPVAEKILVPFTSQAPFKLWDPLHEDACEEASLIMVYHYIKNTPITSATQADKEIKDLISWEVARGYGGSITLSDLNQVAKDYFDMNNGRVIIVSSYQEIKKVLAGGNPLILGMAGKILPNPNFSNGGPNYHMLVAIGYDNTGFITNDPGTRQGQDFHYNYTDFYAAIHDWNATNILNGQKAYLVFP